MFGPGTVDASCVICGRIRLPARAVTLRICDNNMQLCRYEFTCPTCKTDADSEACAHVVAALMKVGARIVRWKIPAEALEPHAGPPLTADDLLDLHQQLEAI